MRARLLAAAIVLAPAFASAQIIAFNNIGPSGAWVNLAAGAAIHGPANPYQEPAVGFVSLVSGQLSEIHIGIAHRFGTLNAYTVDFRADNGGEPGASIKVYNITGVPNYQTNTPPALILDGSGPILTAGTMYWVSVRTTATPTEGIWYENNQGDIGPIASRASPTGPWTVETTFPRYALRVEVVPEPATMLVLGGGLALATLRRRRR